jgi:hypothetical protein
MSEKQPKSTPAEAPASSAASEGFFGSAEDMINREAELNAEAYRNRLRDEALAGIDEYLEENPDMSREEAMQQIVSDLEAYDAKLGDMHKAGDAYGNLEHTIDQTDAGERLDAVDRTIDSDPILRRMNMLAKAVAELRASEATPENLQAIQDKEDKLAELLDKYEDTGEANYDAVDRIFNRTVDGVEARIDRNSSIDEERSGDIDKERDSSIDEDKPSSVEVLQDAIDELVDEESKKSPEEEQIQLQEAYSYKFDEELARELSESLVDYARFTAEGRNSTIRRFASSDKSLAGRLLRKIPVVSKLIDKVNNLMDRPILESKDAYEESIGRAMDSISSQLESQGASIEAIESELRRAQIQSEAEFEGLVLEYRTKYSKDTNKFVDWWVNQKGWKGKAVKAATVLAAGGLVGVAGGFALGASAGGAMVPIVGALTGGAVARHVSKRRANAQMKDYNGATVAEVQASQDFDKKQKLIDSYDFSDDGAELATSEVIDITEGRTSDEILSNRRRMKVAAALGATGASLGSSLGRGLRESLFSEAPGVERAAPGDGGAAAPDGAEQAVPDGAEQAVPSGEPEVLGQNFNVEYGHGYTHELMDFASVNGRSLSPEQAFDLHSSLVDKFGADYIDIAGSNGADIYRYAGDIRLTTPGEAQWVEGVTEFAKQWMVDRGLW